MLGLVFGIFYFINFGLLTDFKLFALPGLEYVIPENKIQFVLITISLTSISNVIFGYIITSALIIVYNVFSCIKYIGTSEFPIKLSFLILRSNSLNQFGKLVISISIPIIFLATCTSIIGYLELIIYKNLLNVYSMIGISIAIIALVLYLLFSNTMDLHNAIFDCKYNLIENILMQIDTEMNNKPPMIDYDNIFKMNELIKEIENIDDWPFNPTSFKKLAASIGSSLFPIVFSFIGLS
jgi:hypothetical protein